MSDLISKRELYYKISETYKKGRLSWGANEIFKDIIGECDSVENKGDLISREDALLCATGEYADDSFEDSIREAECKKIAKRLEELKPAEDENRDFVEIPEGMSNLEVLNLVLRKVFPSTIFIHGSDPYNKTKSIIYSEEWGNEPYKAERLKT